MQQVSVMTKTNIDFVLWTLDLTHNSTKVGVHGREPSFVDGTMHYFHNFTVTNCSFLLQSADASNTCM
jgi:hypothetical protein